MQITTPEQLYKIIGKNVAKYRKQKGLSQLNLSLQMEHKSVSVVSGAEIYYNGKHFNLEHLLKISQILDVDISEFLKPWLDFLLYWWDNIIEFNNYIFSYRVIYTNFLNKSSKRKSLF